MEINLVDFLNSFSDERIVERIREYKAENEALKKRIRELESQIDKLNKRQIGRKKTITKGIEKKVMKYYDSGMSYREIGKRLNISHTSVKNIIDKEVLK